MQISKSAALKIHAGRADSVHTDFKNPQHFDIIPLCACRPRKFAALYGPFACCAGGSQKSAAQLQFVRLLPAQECRQISKICRTITLWRRCYGVQVVQVSFKSSPHNYSGARRFENLPKNQVFKELQATTRIYGAYFPIWVDDKKKNPAFYDYSSISWVPCKCFFAFTAS